MKDAIAHGNRLIMMMNGKIVLDIQGEEKKKLTVKQLLDKFEEASGEEFSNDSAILGKKFNISFSGTAADWFTVWLQFFFCNEISSKSIFENM